jgi:DNA-binding response OmpR family regulator
MQEDRIARAVVAALMEEDVLTMITRRIAGEVASALRADVAVSVEAADAPSAVGDMRIDRARREVQVGDKTLRLKPREFALLETLARRPGRVFRREELLAAAWPDEGVDLTDRTVDVHVARLRRAIGDRRIRTAAGVGYALEDRPE